MTDRADRLWSLAIVDDHPAVLEGLTFGLSLNAPTAAIAPFGSVAELEAAGDHSDIVLMDLFLDGGDSHPPRYADIRRISAGGQRVVAVSGYTRPVVRLDALSAGAMAFIDKATRPTEMVPLLLAAARADGDAVHAPDLNAMSEILGPLRGMAPHLQDVAHQLAQGYGPRDIADHLLLSPHTVKDYESELRIAVEQVRPDLLFEVKRAPNAVREPIVRFLRELGFGARPNEPWRRRSWVELFSRTPTWRP